MLCVFVCVCRGGGGGNVGVGVPVCVFMCTQSCLKVCSGDLVSTGVKVVVVQLHYHLSYHSYIYLLFSGAHYLPIKGFYLVIQR